jgi:hypothetical protein
LLERKSKNMQLQSHENNLLHAKRQTKWRREKRPFQIHRPRNNGETYEGENTEAQSQR